MEYIERTYRNRVASAGLTRFSVSLRESDLSISADRNLYSEALESLMKWRGQLERYIAGHPDFLHSLTPYAVDTFAPSPVRSMIESSLATGIGPMSSVAGMIAEFVGKDLLKYSNDIIIENGGDIFVSRQNSDTKITIFAGESPLSYKVSLKVRASETPIGVCTSSGTVGHSLSFGHADAVCVLSKSAILADSAATALCNQVAAKDDIRKVLDAGALIDGILGIVIIMGDAMGAWGEVELE